MEINNGKPIAIDQPDIQLATLRRQVTQLEGLMESNYQRELRVAGEREAALRLELADMRQDLRVALETLYRMPEGQTVVPNNGDLDALRKQVAAIEAAFGRAVREQERAAVQREASLKAELGHVRRDLLVTLEASYQVPGDNADSIHTEMVAWHGEVEALQSLITGYQQTQEERTLQVQTENREAMTALAERLAGAVAPDASTDETLDRRFRELQTALASEVREVSVLAEERYKRISVEVETKLSEVAHALEALHSLPDDGRTSLELGNLQMAASQIGEDLHSLNSDLISMSDEMRRLQADEHRFAVESIDKLRGQFSESHLVLLAAISEQSDTASQAAPLTADAMSDVVAEQMSALRAQLVKVQSEQYRQLVEQMTQLQSDLDTVNTGMFALQPFTETDDARNAVLNEQFNQVLMTQKSSPLDSTASTEVVDFFRDELAGLRAELQAGLGTLANRPEPRNDIDSVIEAFMAESKAELRREFVDMRAQFLDAIAESQHSRGAQQAAAETQRGDEAQLDIQELRNQFMQAMSVAEQTRYEQQERLLEERDNGIRQELTELREQFLQAVTACDQSRNAENLRLLQDRDECIRHELSQLREQFAQVVSATEQTGSNTDRVAWQQELAHLRVEIATVAEHSNQADSIDTRLLANEVSTLRSEVSAALQELRDRAASSDEPSSVEGELTPGVFSPIAATLRETTERQEQFAAAQATSLNLAIAQMREEMRGVINGLSRESMDTYEKRQTQLRMDQLEMERNLAKLRQELVSSQGDLNGKKKGWR